MASLFDGRSPVFGNDKWPILNHPGRCSYPILHNKRKEGRKEGRERRKERKEKGKKEKERKRKKASKKGTIKKKKKKTPSPSDLDQTCTWFEKFEEWGA